MRSFGWGNDTILFGHQDKIDGSDDMHGADVVPGYLCSIVTFSIITSYGLPQKTRVWHTISKHTSASYPTTPSTKASTSPGPSTYQTAQRCPAPSTVAKPKRRLPFTITHRLNLYLIPVIWNGVWMSWDMAEKQPPAAGTRRACQTHG
jgi:hypothetical protein